MVNWLQYWLAGLRADYSCPLKQFVARVGGSHFKAAVFLSTTVSDITTKKYEATVQRVRNKQMRNLTLIHTNDIHLCISGHRYFDSKRFQVKFSIYRFFFTYLLELIFPAMVAGV